MPVARSRSNVHTQVHASACLNAYTKCVYAADTKFFYLAVVVDELILPPLKFLKVVGRFGRLAVVL